MRSRLHVLVLVLAGLLFVDAQSWSLPADGVYKGDVVFTFDTNTSVADYTVWYMTYTSGYWADIGDVPINTTYVITMPCLQISTTQSIAVNTVNGEAVMFNGTLAMLITQIADSSLRSGGNSSSPTVTPYEVQLYSANVTDGPHIPGYTLTPDGIYTVQFAFFNNETGSLQKVNGTVADVPIFLNPAVPVYIFSPLNDSVWGSILNLTYVPPSPGSNSTNALTLTFVSQGTVVCSVGLNPTWFASSKIYSVTFSLDPMPAFAIDGLFKTLLPPGSNSVPPGVYNISMGFVGEDDGGNVTTTVYNVQLGATAAAPIIYSPTNNTVWSGTLNFTYSLLDEPMTLSHGLDLIFFNGETLVDTIYLDPNCWSGAGSNGTGYYVAYDSSAVPLGPEVSCAIMRDTSQINASSCTLLFLSVSSYSIPPGTYNITLLYFSGNYRQGLAKVQNVTLGSPNGTSIDLCTSSGQCTNETIYVNQTVNRTVYVNQTVYEPCDCSNSDVYPSSIDFGSGSCTNQTVYVNQTVYEPCNCTNQTGYVNRTEPELCSCPKIDFYSMFHDIPLYGWWILLGGGGLVVGSLITLSIAWVCMRPNYMSLST